MAIIIVLARAAAMMPSVVMTATTMAPASVPILLSETNVNVHRARLTQ